VGAGRRTARRRAGGSSDGAGTRGAELHPRCGRTPAPEHPTAHRREHWQTKAPRSSPRLPCKPWGGSGAIFLLRNNIWCVSIIQLLYLVVRYPNSVLSASGKKRAQYCWGATSRLEHQAWSGGLDRRIRTLREDGAVSGAATARSMPSLAPTIVLIGARVTSGKATAA
jgi:hypothetical protein